MSGYKYNYPKIARESGFKLRQFKDGPIDWRFIGSLEVEKIIRDQQFEDIDTILSHLSEAPLGFLLESSVLESGIAKYFALSQLALQYLIFCRHFLDETLKTLRESLCKVEADNAKLRTVNQQHSKEILQLYKKISQIEAINDVVYPCHVCTKNFISNEALNIHLSKKHPKNSLADTQGKDIDRNLINTIKLELEIKQLKERLNIAEKDIRSTVESKKASPREKAKVCSGTQFHTSTSDVGTQSNLVETKDFDSSEEVNRFEILSPLMEKLSKLEINQDSQSALNQESINDIAKKLSDIADVLQTIPKQDSENFTKLVEDAITSKITLKPGLPKNSDEELGLSKTFSEILHLNSEKLNEILTRMESVYNERVPSLELHSEREAKPKKSSKPLRNTINLLSGNVREVPFQERQSSAHHSRTYSIEKPLCEYYSDGAAFVDLNNLYVSANSSLQNVLYEESSTDTSQEMPDTHIDNVEDSNLISKDSEITKQVIQVIDRKLLYYGINWSTKKLSTAEAITISEHLTENRRSLKKIHTGFYATRNKLKNIVERLSNKTQIYTDYHKDPKPIYLNNLTNANRTDLESNEKKSEENDAFKRRLENILSSPIKKPITYVSNGSNESKKPIPMPRKRVFFHKSNEGSMQ